MPDDVEDPKAREARELAEKQALLPGNDTFVQCTYGPYRDRRLQMTNAEADVAESEGWGYRIPANVHEIPEQEELTPEETYEVAKKAHEAAVDLRNEEAVESGPSPTRSARRHDPRKQMEADEEELARRKKNLEADSEAGKYTTRDMKTKK